MPWTTLHGGQAATPTDHGRGKLQQFFAVSFLQFSVFRAFRDYPNPNLNFQVPEVTGSKFSGQISGSNFKTQNMFNPIYPI
jgi:hypothetical protein